MGNLETINDRIAELVKTYGNGRNTVFARLIKNSEGNIRGYINKGVMPKHDVLESMVKNLGISARWLLTGEGPMVEEENAVAVRNEDMLEIPIVEIGASAGGGGYSNPTYMEREGTIEMPYSMVRRNGKYFCIRVKGESMSPTILDSGYLVVRLLENAEWQDITDNHVYVISTREGSAYVKRVRNRLRERGFIVCTSDNPDKATFPNFNLYQEELHSIFRVEWYFTAKMPNIQQTYFKRIDDLEKKYDDLREMMFEIKGRIEIRK